MSVLASRLEGLEAEKAMLLDRLEALTGQPQGGVWDKPPPTPPGINVHASRPARRGNAAAAAMTPERALRSIARIVYMGAGRKGEGVATRISALASGKTVTSEAEALHETPEGVVAAVRGMRDERDEMRKRDARQLGQLQQAQEQLRVLETFVDQRDAIEECGA